jgi:hypothetical protein
MAPPRASPDGTGGVDMQPKRFQMRVVTTPSIRQEFLDMCARENLIPNRVLGGYIERAVKRGRP